MFALWGVLGVLSLRLRHANFLAEHGLLKALAAILGGTLFLLSMKQLFKINEEHKARISAAQDLRRPTLLALSLVVGGVALLSSLFVLRGAPGFNLLRLVGDWLVFFSLSAALSGGALLRAIWDRKKELQAG